MRQELRWTVNFPFMSYYAQVSAREFWMVRRRGIWCWRRWEVLFKIYIVGFDWGYCLISERRLARLPTLREAQKYCEVMQTLKNAGTIEPAKMGERIE